MGGAANHTLKTHRAQIVGCAAAGGLEGGEESVSCCCQFCVKMVCIGALHSCTCVMLQVEDWTIIINNNRFVGFCIWLVHNLFISVALRSTMVQELFHHLEVFARSKKVCWSVSLAKVSPTNAECRCLYFSSTLLCRVV